MSIDTIQVIAALRRAEDDHASFDLVARWTLGDGVSDKLPSCDDGFDVTIEEISRDGSLVLRELAREHVAPLLYFMLDPPRSTQKWAFPLDGKWSQAQRPTRAVDPDDSIDGNMEGKPFGVLHLLQDTHRARVAFRVAQRLRKGLAELHIAGSDVLATRLGNAALADNLSARFAVWLVGGEHRADHIPRLLRQTAGMLGTASGAMTFDQGTALPMDLWSEPELNVAAPTPRMGARHVDRVVDLALLARVFADGTTLDDVARIKTQAEQARRHIRLRMLHGGCLIDYWSNPAGGIGDATLRGLPRMSSEALGLGRSFRFPEQVVQAAMNAGHGLRVNVIQRKVAQEFWQSSSTQLSERAPGVLTAAAGVENFNDGATTLTYVDLKRALMSGSSHPVPRPPGARIDYDLFQTPPAGVQGNDRDQVGFRTGDGRVEIAIDPLPNGSSAIAFNVYGMWEGHPLSNPFFADPGHVPSAAELKKLRPWLMTRRYSLGKDLELALTDSGGAPLKALAMEIENPCWQPLLPRPDIAIDITNPTGDAPLPARGAEKSASFAYDLRKDFFGSGVQSALPRWDGAAPPDPTWTADRWRPGTHPPTAATPQRYRFFVTAVDLLDQESAPLAVSCEDRDAQESASFVFTLRQRAALSGPPGETAGAQFGLSYERSTTDPLAGALTLKFETPQKNSAAGDSSGGGASQREDAGRLTATAMILRRRPKRPPEGGAAKVGPAAVNAESMWKVQLTKLEGDGWRPFRTTTVAAPAAGHVWGTQVSLGDTDLGYEYIAAVGFAIADAWRELWCPDVIGKRTVQLCRLQGGAYVFTPAKTDEILSVSALAVTLPCAILDTRPNAVPALDTAVESFAAIPIPAPPGLDRDLVLQRIASSEFVDVDKPCPRRPWGRSRSDSNANSGWAELTEGQIVMCEAALRRTIAHGIPFAAEADALELARRLLALDTQQRQNAKMLRQSAQHPTIGFRGLAALRWQYVAQADLPRAQRREFAETSAFRIYQARAPLEQRHAAANAAAAGQASLRKDGRYAIAFTPTAATPTLISTLITSGATALARLDSRDGAAVAVIAEAERGADATSIICTLMRVGGHPMPDAAPLTLHMGQALALVEARSEYPGGPYEALVPLSGGPAEVFAWWIGAVSFTGVEAPPAPAAGGFLELDGSVQPEPPSAFWVEPPSRREHALDKVSSFRDFLPVKIEDPEDASSLPRLVLQWSADDTSPDVYVALERIEEQVRDQSGKLSQLAMADSPWEAISNIGALREGQPIELTWLRAIATNWLMGSTVEVEGVAVAKRIFHILGPSSVVSRRLTQRAGLITTTAPSDADAGPTYPTFIDYFGRNGDERSVMDGNWQYRYRLTTYRDLKNGLDEEWRFLCSRPTAWTQSVVPETPPIFLSRSLTQAARSDLVRPLVQFVFQTRDGEDSGMLRWRYRAMLRRKLEVPMPSTGGAARDVWIDVGMPLMFQPDGKPAVIEDSNIDREWPGETARFNYRVFVQQFRQDLEGEADIEVLVRNYDVRTDGAGYSDFTVDIPAPNIPEREEMVVIVAFVIR